MFALVKKSDQYLQIVEYRKVGGKVIQRAVTTVGTIETYMDTKKKRPHATTVASLSSW